MISTALVPISSSLHTSVADTNWLIVGLYMTCAVAQPSMGRFADLFGPRRIFLMSLVFVAAAGVFGWLASSLTALVGVRVLLGIGTSAAYPAAGGRAARTHSKQWEPTVASRRQSGQAGRPHRVADPAGQRTDHPQARLPDEFGGQRPRLGRAAQHEYRATLHCPPRAHSPTGRRSR